MQDERTEGDADASWERFRLRGEGAHLPQVEALKPMAESASRPRAAQRVAVVAGSLVGVSSFVGPDDDRFGLVLVAVVAAFVGWLASRVGASPWQIILSVLLALAAMVVSRVITFVILYLWAFG